MGKKLKTDIKFFAEIIQILYYCMKQGDAFFQANDLYFTFRVTRNQYPLPFINGFSGPESLYPFIHMFFEIRCRPKCINPHCSKKMTYSFTRHFIWHRHKSRKW